MSESTGDSRDAASMRHFKSRSSGRRVYEPQTASIPGNIICDCATDPDTGASYCSCGGIIASDTGFGPDHMRNIIHPSVRVNSPRELAALKRRQMFLAKSHA
jgi:hypothetical protein